MSLSQFTAFYFALIFSIAPNAQAQILEGCPDASQYLVRGNFDDPSPGGRLWNLDRLAAAKRAEGASACTNQTYDQALTDAKGYWNSIKSRCEGGSNPKPDCSRVEENLNYINVIEFGRRGGPRQVMSPRPTCDSGAVERLGADLAPIIEHFPPRADDRNCPTRLADQRRSDRSNYQSAWRRDPAAKACTEVPGLLVGEFKSAAEFEKYISSNQAFSSVNSAFITSSHCAQYFGDLSEPEKAGVVADYYHFKNSLETAELGLVNGLSEIDSLLADGENFAARAACGNSRGNHVKTWCDKLKTCGNNPEGLGDMQQRVTADLEKLATIDEAEHKEFLEVNERFRLNTREGSDLAMSRALNNVIAKFKVFKDAIKTSNPILYQTKFDRAADALKNPNGTLEGALRDQRAQMKTKLNQVRGKWDCLDKNTCSANDLAKFLKTVPSKIPDRAAPSDDDEQKAWQAENAMRSAQQCTDLREENNAVGWKTVDYTVGFASLVTPAGWYFKAARVAAFTATVANVGMLAATVKQGVDTYSSCMGEKTSNVSAGAFSRGAPECGSTAAVSSVTAHDSKCSSDLFNLGVRAGLFAAGRVVARAAAPRAQPPPSTALQRQPPVRVVDGEVVPDSAALVPRPPQPVPRPQVGTGRPPPRGQIGPAGDAAGATRPPPGPAASSASGSGGRNGAANAAGSGGRSMTSRQLEFIQGQLRADTNAFKSKVKDILNAKKGVNDTKAAIEAAQQEAIKRSQQLSANNSQLSGASRETSQRLTSMAETHERQVLEVMDCLSQMAELWVGLPDQVILKCLGRAYY
ncbi:MAG: hypothetical protein ABL958_06635 [Bdellovibrionia bacterium]